ncbi:MAG TPA: hypothetical protein VK978_01595 [Candidatus Saccharimonadales bacterium]|nr:hypothetical protein [Candidatus Saccharimonadales bacterium]
MKMKNDGPTILGVAGDRYDAGGSFVASVPLMAQLARIAAANLAYSYRGLHVGAAGMFVDSDNNLDILTAGNLKSKKNKEKVCAEKQDLAKAVKRGAIKAVGLVVAGPTDVELIKGITGRESPTLHCCEECRIMMEDHPLVDDETPIVTVGLNSNVYQSHGNKQLRDLYAGVDGVRESAAYDLEYNWEKRQDMYRYNAVAERMIDEDQRRSPAVLARLALSASL